MKILLIEFNPFQPAHTPISLGYLAAYVKRHGHEAKILNLGSDTLLSMRQFSGRLLTYRPDVIGFSAYQRNIFLVHGWATYCKNLLPHVKIVLGGPQATFLPTEALSELPAVDLICRAEGETALLVLANKIAGGDLIFEGVPGWSGRSLEGGFWDTPPLKQKEDLDDYPSPYLDGTLDLQGVEEAILLASRGCPYRCAFCYTPAAFGRKIRCHSMERVVEEIAWITGKGVNRFWFADPSFTFHAERIHGLFDILCARKLKAEIWLETRVDLVDEPLLKMMRRAGVHTVAYGLETASERVRKRIRKPLVPEQVERAVRITQEAGLEDVELFSQYGLPGESYEDALETLAFVKGNGVRIRGNTNSQQMQIYFGTDVQNEYDRYGILPFSEFTPGYLSIGARYETDRMNARDIQDIGRLWKESSEDGGKHIVS